MKKLRLLLPISLLVMIVSLPLAAQKKEKKRKKGQVEALKLYEGGELPLEKISLITADDQKKQYVYFIAVNDEPIANNSLMDGPRQILLLPGEHKIKMRFVAKGEIAIPVQPFESVSFEGGKKYTVRFEYAPAEDASKSYFGGGEGTRITLWIESDENRIAELTVNGMGEVVE